METVEAPTPLSRRGRRLNSSLRRRIRWPVAILIAVALATACGSDLESDSAPTSVDTNEGAAATSATSGPDESDSERQTTVEPGATEATEIRVSEADVAEAREAFQESKKKWAKLGVTNYTLIYENTTQSFSVPVVGGLPVASAELDAAEERNFATTVDDQFLRIEGILSLVEVDPSLIGTAEGGCKGIFFTIAFDSESGAPLIVDSLSPCEDGDPYWITVVPEA